MTDPVITDLFGRAGHLLWRELPEEYRYRDNPQTDEPGDLEAYLQAMGHLLDLIRGTTEQMHADSFAEAVGGREIQPWLLPYLGDLVGAELAAPDPAQRVAELNASVGWYKSKGTLANIDDVGDVLTGAETVAREGWRLVATCPRVYLPPFTLPAALASGSDGQPARPLGMPDVRRCDRAVRDPSGANPLFRITQPRRDARGAVAAPDTAYWRSIAAGGVPCFPGAYDDLMPRCPDLRDPSVTARPGPHPRRTLIHIRPPDGLFAAGLATLTLPAAALQATDDGPMVLTPITAFALAGQPLRADEAVPDRVQLRLDGDVIVAPGRELRLEGILILAAPATPRVIVKPGAKLVMDRAAAPRIVLEGQGPLHGGLADPALDARDSLIGTIAGGVGFARLEYVTVLDHTDVTVLQASDCILGTLGNNFDCSAGADGDGPRSCLRYCRATPPEAPAQAICQHLSGASNTSLRPRFADRVICTDGQPVQIRPARYGEAGCAVLSPLSPRAIREGAEDDGEMGAHHHMFHAAKLAALTHKLAAFLPLGQETAIFYDPMLALMPPVQTAESP
jgi:hypothetical protein